LCGYVGCIFVDVVHVFYVNFNRGQSCGPSVVFFLTLVGTVDGNRADAPSS
jgi:hypothetical protein